ncbi:MAG: glycosyltransferase, partial [Alicyclobacillaceae bacterium]|nr:glycosyltransferase [Alicyclobacillaceae bacterium]
FAAWLSRLNPAWAMTTHPFSLSLLERCRRSGWRGRFGALVTDFHVHRFWWSPSADWYCVPFPWMRDELTALGYPSERVFVTGFPVRSVFHRPVSRREIEDKFGWDRVSRVLCMGGGFGLGEVVQWLDWIDASSLEFEMVVVAGRNERLYRELHRHRNRWRHTCRVLGYCEAIHEVYAVCDVLVTKPGTATVMEAAAMELPLVCAPPLPGHEEDNARALARLGVISGPTVGSAMMEAVERLLSDEGARRRVKDRLRGIARPDAAETVADVLGSEQVK